MLNYKWQSREDAVSVLKAVEAVAGEAVAVGGVVCLAERIDGHAGVARQIIKIVALNAVLVGGVVLDAVEDRSSGHSCHLTLSGFADGVAFVAGIALMGLEVEGLAEGIDGGAVRR
jgi:hypothetical protein